MFLLGENGVSIRREWRPYWERVVSLLGENSVITGARVVSLLGEIGVLLGEDGVSAGRYNGAPIRRK